MLFSKRICHYAAGILFVNDGLVFEFHDYLPHTGCSQAGD
jgi:hypothetical protein